MYAFMNKMNEYNANVFGLGGINLLHWFYFRASTETCYCEYLHRHAVSI